MTTTAKQKYTNLAPTVRTGALLGPKDGPVTMKIISRIKQLQIDLAVGFIQAFLK